MELTLDGKTVRYANGGRAHDPALPGVVLVHGAGMNRTVWQLQTRYLAHHGFRVAALDLPGHGQPLQEQNAVPAAAWKRPT